MCSVLKAEDHVRSARFLPGSVYERGFGSSPTARGGVLKRMLLARVLGTGSVIDTFSGAAAV